MGVITSSIASDVAYQLATLSHTGIFIETGTFRGDTTRWAARHFQSVYTIERARGLFDLYSRDLSQLKGVHPLLGDSREVLPKVVSEIGDENAMFWLDGHWSGGETAGSDDECPLMAELACIVNRPNDIILIDDARLFLCAPPKPHMPSHWPTIADILDVFSRSHIQRFIQIVDDVIFVVPDAKNLRAALTDYAQARGERMWQDLFRLQQFRARKRRIESLFRRA